MTTTGSSPVSLGTDDKTYFYFTVFLLHNPPLFHSNRIPINSLYLSPNTNGATGSSENGSGDASSGRTPSKVVGEFKELDAYMLQEVPQQSLQQVAFPTSFGVNAKTARSLLYGQKVWESEDTLEGPPWRMELEEVRTGKGELQQYRLIVTSTFSTRVTSFKNATVSMQSRPAAVALVVCCPPSGTHYRFLIHHFGVVRTVLHSLLSFGIHIVQRFFTELLTLTSSGQCRQQEAFRRAVVGLEGDADGVGTYMYIRHVLHNALSVADCLPALHPLAYRHVYLPFPRKKMGAPLKDTVTLSSPSDMASECTAALVRFSEAFTCALFCGLLSVGEPGHSSLPFQRKLSHGAESSRVAPHLHSGALPSPQVSFVRRGDPVEMDPYASFWSQWEKTKEEEEETDEQGRAKNKEGRQERGSRRASPSPGPPDRPRMDKKATPPALELPRARTTTTWSEGEPSQSSPCDRASTANAASFSTNNRPPASVDDEESYVPSGRQVSRVLIFCTDPVMAMNLLIVCAFMRRRNEESVALAHPDGATAVEMCRFRAAMYELAFAGHTPHSDYAGLAVQWICEEYHEDRLYKLCSPFSVDNTLLIVAPRQLLCRRVVLRKRIESTSVMLEQHGGQSVRRVSAAQPFRCDVWRNEVISADPLVSTLLRESLQLNQSSGGTIPFTATISDMMRWVSWMGLASLMRGRAVAAQYGARHQGQADDRAPSSSPSYLAQHYHFPRTLPLPVVTDAKSKDKGGGDLVVSEALLPGSAGGSIDTLLSGRGLLVSSQALAAVPSVSASTSTGLISVSDQSSVDSQLQRLLYGDLNSCGDSVL